MESTDAARDATSADSMLAALCDRVRGLVLCDIVGTSKFTWTIHRALGSILQIRDCIPIFGQRGSADVHPTGIDLVGVTLPSRSL